MREMFIQRCRYFLQRYVYGAQENTDGKPLVVPVEERAVIDASDLSEHQFTINPTWLAYGKKAGQKLLSQAVGSSQLIPHDGDVSFDEDGIDSRDDNENSYREEMQMGCDWGKETLCTCSNQENWSAGPCDNVRAVPVRQMRKTTSSTCSTGRRSCVVDVCNYLEERRDAADDILSDQDEDHDGEEEEEDHSTYFERSACAIADVAGPENDHYRFMNDQNNANYGNTFCQQQQRQFFKKGRRKLLFNRSKGPSF